MTAGRAGVAAWTLLSLLLVSCSSGGLARFAPGFAAHRIEPVSSRLEANGEFVDVRFRLRGTGPFDPNPTDTYLVDESTGERFYLLQLQRIGQVGAKTTQEEDPVHSILFRNRGGILKPGSRVTLVIGSERREGLLLER